MQTTKSKGRMGVRQLTIIGMLSGISIFMGVTGLGFIPIPPVKLTIMHLPVIIGAILEGPVVGALVGLVFGLFSMYQAFTAPWPTTFMFMNPIVALIPRILIGVVAYYVYTLLKNKFKNKSIAIATSATLATMTNTIGVLGLTYILYLERYAQAAEISTTAVAGVLGGLFLTNGVPEALLAGFITVPVVLTLKKVSKRR
ncbi:MAG: ECF transporter S component [Clostridium sp.]